MAIELTAEETAVLAHVVVDPAAWLESARAGFAAHGDPEEIVDVRLRDALTQKVGRWQPAYEEEKTRLSGAYRTRAQREAE